MTLPEIQFERDEPTSMALVNVSHKEEAKTEKQEPRTKTDTPPTDVTTIANNEVQFFSRFASKIFPNKEHDCDSVNNAETLKALS